MSSSAPLVILIVAALFISRDGLTLVLETVDHEILPHPTTFLQNFFHNQCQSNEEMSDCQILTGGTCWSPPIGSNFRKCIRGCNCIDGFLRNSNGNCVRQEQCDTTAKPMDHVEPLDIISSVLNTDASSSESSNKFCQ